MLSVSGSVDIHCVTFIEPFLYSRKEVNLVLVKDFSLVLNSTGKYYLEILEFTYIKGRLVCAAFCV